MHQKETLFANLEKIIKGAQVLDLPVIWTEQVPENLGPTLPELSGLLARSAQPIGKASFSCCGVGSFVTSLRQVKRRQVLVTGIESHICVYQTSIDLLAEGYEVQVVTDAVSSRKVANRQIGLDRMHSAGAKLTSTEMALFELLRVVEGDKFRQISKIVK